VEKHFGGTRLAQNFCARWQGVIRCPADATYTFYTESDDGSQLYIDGRRVVDNGGDHAMRERQGEARLSAGDHDLRLEFIQGEGEAGCRMSWTYAGRAKEIVPADVLFHRPRRGAANASGELQPGLIGEFYELGGRLETFPDGAASAFDTRLAAVAGDQGRPLEVRVQAAAAVTPRLEHLDASLFGFLLSSLDQNNSPLVRLDAADALAKAHLDDDQLLALCPAVAAGGVLEVPRLLAAFQGRASAAVGEALVAALARSPGLRSLQADSLAVALAGYPEAIRRQADPLLKQLAVDVEKQQARLAELQSVLSGGDVQRGRELFFGNKKAICATCHAVQGRGGQFGPDLTKIAAIRAPRDLVEAIVLPSASFARGYEPFNIVTQDGQVVSGIIARETADAIHVVSTSRAETRVPRSAVESIAQSTVSIMPEGMDQQLSRQELADLIEFLSSLR
jgi:putative heme-binding domain-containing protein